jgi:DNA ligase-associated metallophosphoesterase
MPESQMLEWAGQRWELLAGRAAWWPAARTLIAADLHLGKARHFRAHGVPVPRGTTGDTLGRLTDLLHQTAARRLLVLGDLFHARAGVDAGLVQQLTAWRTTHPGVTMLNVRGNHDQRAGDPPPEVDIRCIDRLSEADVDFVHDPAAASDLPIMAGHIHPCVKLGGRGGDRMRAPCFHFGPRVAVLPAFGAFTGCHPMPVRRGDAVFVVGPGTIMQLTGSRRPAHA